MSRSNWVPSPRVCYLLTVTMAVFTLAAGAPAMADYAVIHNFAGGSSDGASPWGSLIESGTTLYGMTLGGGSHSSGTIFQMDANGSSFSLVHTFGGGSSDGQTPYGSLVMSGGNFYGMTSGGGNSSTSGVVFQCWPSTQGFNDMFNVGVGGTGTWPQGSLVVSSNGGLVYGLTYNGGSASNRGTVFSVDTASHNQSVLHTFKDSNVGAYPRGSLLLSGTTLYGMTSGDSSQDKGTIFQVGTDATSFKTLHTFVGGANDGRDPKNGALIQSGTVLYGMTSAGGASNVGTIFSYDTNDGNFQVLYSFQGGPSDGSYPYGSLVQSGTTLYGMTSSGGSQYSYGTVFAFDTVSNTINILHNFTAGTGDGRVPYGSLLLDGSTLYGMTSTGGQNNQGTIFSITVPEPTSLGLLALGLLAVVRRRTREV